jgi:Flp pilus assembly protein TadG
MRSGRRRDRGQALVEFCLITPVLLLFVLLSVDLGRAYFMAVDASGASRAGVRMGIISDTSDIGEAIRAEPNTGIPNTLAAWGSVGPGTANGTCVTASGTCGDPNGCVSTSFSGAQFACFAVRGCNLSAGGDLGTCTSYGAWGIRPQLGSPSHGLVIKVVIKFSAVTPALGVIVPSGLLYLTQNSVGEELYF